MTNTLPPLPLVDGALLIDNSFLEALITCPRKLLYDRLMRRRLAIEKPALSFGTALHKALEYRYRNCKNESPMPETNQAIVDKVLAPYFKENPQPEDDHRTLDFASELVKHYNQRYLVEPFQLVLNNKGEVMTEMSFALPLFDYEQVMDGFHVKVPVIYMGRVDLPVLWDSQIFVLDHKTTSMLGDFYFDGQKIAPQYEGYVWAFEQLTGKQVSGFVINAIRTKAPPAKPKNGMDNWWNEGFARHKEYLRPNQIAEWKTNTIALIKEFFYHYQSGYMPQKKKACTLYGKCAYYDVCYLPQEQREAELASDKFETNDWSPLK